MFIYLSNSNSAEQGRTESMHENRKSVCSSLTRSSYKCFFCIILQWMEHIIKPISSVCKYITINLIWLRLNFCIDSHEWYEPGHLIAGQIDSKPPNKERPSHLTRPVTSMRDRNTGHIEQTGRKCTINMKFRSTYFNSDGTVDEEDADKRIINLF